MKLVSFLHRSSRTRVVFGRVTGLELSKFMTTSSRNLQDQENGSQQNDLKREAQNLFSICQIFKLTTRATAAWPKIREFVTSTHRLSVKVLRASRDQALSDGGGRQRRRQVHDFVRPSRLAALAQKCPLCLCQLQELAEKSYLCLSSVFLVRSADSWAMSERRTGWSRGHGDWLKIFDGSTASQTETKSVKSAAYRA